MSSAFGNLDNTVEIRLSGTRLLTSGFDNPFSLSSEKRLKISGAGNGFVQIFADVNNNGVVEGEIDVILAQQSLDVLASNPIAQNFNPGNYIFRAASFDVQREGAYQINLEIDQLFRRMDEQQAEIRGMQLENRRILDILLNQSNREDPPE